MKLFIDKEGIQLDGEERFLAWLEAEFRRESGEGSVNLVLVGNDVIEELNQAYLGHEGPTDVISFNFEDGEENEPDIPEPEAPSEDEQELDELPFPAGEVYVSLDMAQQQAREYEVSLTEELSRLALHGMLHIAGWLDDSDEARKAMSRREDQGLARAREGATQLPWVVIGQVEQEA